MSTEARMGESQAHIVNPANAVTVLRLVLAFVLVALYVRYGWDGAVRLMYCAVFALAMATDWVDGYLAKTFGWETEFGQWLDPLADKVNVGSALVVLSVQYPVLWIATVLILAREGLMTLMRSVARQRGQGSMPARPGGKRKTVVQAMAIMVCLVPLEQVMPLWLLVPLRVGLVILAVWLTYSSLLEYWREFRVMGRTASS